MPDVHAIEAARREAMARRSFEAAPPMAEMVEGAPEAPGMRMTPAVKWPQRAADAACRRNRPKTRSLVNVGA